MRHGMKDGENIRGIVGRERVRDRSGKPGARYERGLAADSPTPCVSLGARTGCCYLF